MGLGANKMVKLFSFLFITVFFISNGRSQKLYIPVSNEEIIKIYKLGKKSSSGEYVYTDKDGNIRIKGKFNKISSIGIVGFHLIEQKRAFSLRFLLSSGADSVTPAVISEIEPSGGCSV